MEATRTRANESWQRFTCSVNRRTATTVSGLPTFTAWEFDHLSRQQDLHLEMPGKAKNAENRRYAREAAEAAEELGMLSTVEQIAKLNHHRSIPHGSKAKIWQKYIEKKCGKRQFAIEQDVTMYNLIGQTRAFFVSEGDADNKVYASLKRVLELWISLVVAEKLHLVFQHEDYKGVGALKN